MGIWLIVLFVWTVGIPAGVIGGLLLLESLKRPSRCRAPRMRVPVLGHRRVRRAACQGAAYGARRGIRPHVSIR